MFTTLQYHAFLINRVIKDTIDPTRTPAVKCNDPAQPSPVRIILPFKSAELSKTLRSDFKDLNSRLHTNILPVFTSSKVKDMLNTPKSAVDDIVSKSKVVYQYRCSCNLSCIGYTSRYLHQRILEHRRQTKAIYQHCINTGHEFSESNFSIIAKCNSKFDCMVRESHEIYFRRPSLNARDEYSCSLLYRLRL